MTTKFRILLPLIAVTFSLISCLDMDTEERTLETEKGELDIYLNSLITKGYNVDTTDLGVYYVKLESGEGQFPQKGDTLSVAYAGYLIDGTLFQSTLMNSTDSTMTFRFLEDRMIAGFEDGMKLMNKGARIQLIIPSEFAYGAYGSYSIAPYATLIFVTKMVDIKPVATN